MDESEDNLSADDIKMDRTLTPIKSKPRKKSIVERELETTLTARVTSPMTNGEVCGISRYGRALRHKTDSEFIDSDKILMKPMKSLAVEKTPVVEKIPPVERTPTVEKTTQSPPVYKMHASNSPVKGDNSKRTPIKIESVESNLENQIENIYNENISLSRFGSGEKRKSSPVIHPKVYVRKDLIQTKEKDETITLLKNMFPPKSGRKSNSHLSNVLERSSEKYEINSSGKKSASSNIALNNSSVVKTLDFDSNKKKKENSNKILLSKSELFELEAKCEYQVGDLAWARMGTYPFWPCIVTREPESDMFVRKKLFGRVERDIIHVRFFGDNGRRSWIVETMLRKFLGQLEFEATREHFSPTTKKKDPRLYAAFFISEKKMPQWSISVEEAETLLREPKRLRIDIFNDMLIKSRSLKVAKPKSGKITRTNSDVSLSESLYDTLFSGNDGKSEDSDGSRSKTRKSLDVSEVVTACLDNMAAKTGLSKIQKQSHMDRWLQKAKSKTPEKSQVKLPVPPKEKVISSKKKRCIAPKNFPFIKPYSLRKSHESQNLMSHNNEHDYSCTVKEGEVTEITFEITTKIEPLNDKVDDIDTPAKVDTFETNGTTCESPTYTQDYEDLIFAHEVHIERTSSNLEEASNTTTANSNSVNDKNMSIEKETNNEIIDLTEDRIHSSVPLDGDSNENANEKSTEISNNNTNVNNKTDKASTYLHMNGHLEDNMNIDTNVDSQNSVNVKSVNDTPLNKAQKADNVELKIDVDSLKSVKEDETSILNSTTASQCNSCDPNDVNLSTQSIENTDNDTSLDNLTQTLEDTKNNCVFLKPVVRSRTVRKRSSHLKNCTKANTRKTKDDALAKYVELRRDALMDENPELPQTEISVNDTPFNDLNKTKNVELKMGVDSPKSVKENETILNSTTASQCNSYDPNDVNLSTQNIEKTDTGTSLDDLSQSVENSKANTSKINDDAFAKYVELQKDVLMDENPKLTQTETSVNDTMNDLNKTDNVELIIDVDSLKENETCILHSSESQNDSYDPNDVNLNTQSIEKTDTDTSLNDLSQSLENTKANTSKTNDDNFATHVELRKDSLMDENPELSLAEISVNDTSLNDLNKRDNIEFKMNVNSLMENETSILNSSISQCDSYDPSAVNLSTRSIEKTDTDTSLDNLSQSLENTEKNCLFTKPVVCPNTERKRSIRLKNRFKAKPSKANDDAFAKYVELRKDALMEENPELSPTEIIEYLLKTWQYEKGDIPVKVPRNIIYDIKATEVVKSNDTNDKISTINLNAKKKVCTVTLTDIITNDKKASEVVKNNKTNAKTSTIHVNAKKRVCTVTLTDILLQKHMSLAFKNGKKTCILPIIGSSNDFNNALRNCITKNESDTFDTISNKSTELTNVNALNNYEMTSDNLDSGLSSSISLSNEDSNDLTKKDDIKSNIENMDSKLPLNIPLVDYKQRNYDNAYSTEIVVEIVNEKSDSEILDFNTAPEKHTGFNDTKSDLEISSLHNSLNNESLIGDNEIIEKDTQKNATSNDRIEFLKNKESEKESTLTETSNETIHTTQVDTTDNKMIQSLKNAESEKGSTLTKTSNKTIDDIQVDTTDNVDNVIESLKNAESAKENALTKPSNHIHLINTIEHQNNILKDFSSSSTSEKFLTSVNNSTKSEQQYIQKDSVLENQDKLASKPAATINELTIESERISNNKTESNLNNNEEEVDRILKSIDDFINDKDSAANDKCLELRNINNNEKEVQENEETTQMDCGNNISEDVSMEIPKYPENVTGTGDGDRIVNVTTRVVGEISEHEPKTQENVMDLKGEISDSEETCHQNIQQPIIMNGYHSIDDCTPDVSDGEFNVETSSIHSEDSEPLSIVKSKLLLKNRHKMKKDFDNPEFLKYMEMRQDAIMDEHPELNQEEIIEYMYKTWQYEGTTKSDFMKTDDIEQSGLVKGLNDSLRQKSIRNSYRANKKRKPKPICEDTLSISSDTSDTSVRRKLRQRSVQSPVVVIEDNLSKGLDRILMDYNDDFKSTNSYITEKSTKTKYNLDDPSKTDLTHKNKSLNSPLTLENKIENNQENSQINRICHSEEATRHNTASKDNESKKYFNIFKQTEKKNKNREVKTEFEAKVKEEYDPETVSINSEDSEISVSKRKQRKYADKEPSKDDPEFLKYLELRQDALIDEHPELSEDDIVSYLFKTWLYEESVKSDIKKSDDIEQAGLVKGLNADIQQPKKVKKKIKVEKELTTDEDLAQKDKPKRKISQPYYVEDELSDSEDIEIFDIFKSKQKLSTDGTNEISEVEDDVVDEVELYFQDLIKPKPNVFKGHIKEKVCDICERTSNLVKCKGCNSMFHVDCVRKEIEVKVEPSTPLKGRKKKKKPGRKSKNLDESECYSDDKSQDVSEENNVSIEDIPELETYTVDAENFESLLEVKMKELISAEANYDTSFSDCAITWNGTIAGKCEIVDVKLQAKMEPDYSDFKCNKCQMYDIPVCFVCQMAISKSGVEYRQRCQTAQCCRYYHMECLDHWPQTQYHAKDLSKIGNQNERFEEFMCPRHVCHTCVSDDPRGCKTRFSGDKLARCVRCPATYHTFTKCLPAGSQILTASHIICPRHNEHRPGKAPCHVNTGWCFICALGGSLICCEYCPTSFHAECLNIKPPEGGYMCEDCETGRLPLYGEMVWVKLGHYRWWPGLILHPSEIPNNIMAVKHSPGEFVVRFFGQYDYYWVNRGRVFPFQEGDSGRLSGTKSKIDAAFTTAMEHAQRACEIMKRAVVNEEEETDIASSLLPPHYVKLKVNKPVGSVVSRRADVEESSLTQCDCNPDVEDPCGPYSHCLNRMLLTECGPSCRAGDRCNNRAFEKRLYPRMAPYRTPQRGWGLRALEDIKAGQFVIEYVGELIDEEEFRRRMNRKHEIRDENFYFLTLDKERMIDAGPKGNLARFMNHCCEPNCETQKWTVLGDVRVGLFAINDIPANSELTFNYNLECVGIEKKRCLCGAKRCSGYMGAKPKQDDQPKKAKRTYKKRKPAEDSPSTSKNKPKKPIGRPAKPKELTEIEKDLLIIKNATNGISSDSECSGRLSSLEFDRNTNTLKRKKVDFLTEDGDSSSKKVKIDDDKPIEVGD